MRDAPPPHRYPVTPSRQHPQTHTAPGSILTGYTSDARKAFPVATGVLDYFPDALLAVAECSMVGNEQQNPGSEMHWDRSKSTGHANCLLRHLIQRGTKDTDGIRHSAKVAWRALALLQVEIENGLHAKA